ncbi:hypothetical protein B0T13DRAFT_458403 [Neurospora crassa]|nr:hypothetical protein B0T13DRAFT_458403 [Neurospora crassa]
MSPTIRLRFSPRSCPVHQFPFIFSNSSSFFSLVEPNREPETGPTSLESPVGTPSFASPEVIFSASAFSWVTCRHPRFCLNMYLHVVTMFALPGLQIQHRFPSLIVVFCCSLLSLYFCSSSYQHRYRVEYLEGSCSAKWRLWSRTIRSIVKK